MPQEKLIIPLKTTAVNKTLNRLGKANINAQVNYSGKTSSSIIVDVNNVYDAFKAGTKINKKDLI
jgi:hypothetical protein